MDSCPLCRTIPLPTLFSTNQARQMLEMQAGAESDELYAACLPPCADKLRWASRSGSHK